MKLATWNVNSLRVRLPQVIDWLETHQPDVLCLQETKVQDENFPLDEITAAGYQSVFVGQKTFNGVALLSKQTGEDVVTAIPELDDVQKRVIAATYVDVRVICVYIPNGESVESDKYQYKINWLRALHEWLQEEIVKHPKLALLGDYNIAPEDQDTYDAVAWKDKVLCSQPERDAYHGLLNLGLVDSFRMFEQPDQSFTWWDYRMMAFRRNRGMRIDHILLSETLSHHCVSCVIDRSVRKLERPSDHAPVMVELAKMSK